MATALSRCCARDTKDLAACKLYKTMHNLVVNGCGSPGWVRTICLPQQSLLGPGDKDTCYTLFGYLRPLAANLPEWIFHTSGFTVASRYMWR